MKSIFEADQAARTGTECNPPEYWIEVTKQDAERRARTKALLDAGQLRTGDDFVHAAFVFQHGN